MLNGLDEDGNIIISSKRQHYLFEDLAVSNSSTNVKASLIFDEVTKLKESNIMVAANCI